jgi:hypothetical protein
VQRIVFRDKRGKFTRPNRDKITTREIYFGVSGKKFSEARGRFKAPSIKRKLKQVAPARLLWEGKNHGKRFEDLLAEHSIISKLRAVHARRVLIEVETYYPGSNNPIRVIREILLAQKGKNKTQQNKMILLKTLIHSLDGKGLKMYARKHLPKNEQQRYFAANQRKTKIRIIALAKGSQYRRPEPFAEIPIDLGVYGRREKKKRARSGKSQKH